MSQQSRQRNSLRVPARATDVDARQRAAIARRGAGAGLAAAALLLIGGCAPQTSTVARPPVVRTAPKPPPAPIDWDARLAELHKRSADFSALVQSLPKASDADNRAAIQDAFAQLTALLPQLQTGANAGVFEHQLTVVDLTRKDLANGSPNLAIGPIVDGGLRASANALDDLQHERSYYDVAPLRKTLDDLSAKLQDLDSTQGAEHSQIWADSFVLVSSAVDTMAATLTRELTENSNPATAPITQPAAPATEPAAGAPATAPAEPKTEPTATPTTGPASAGPASAGSATTGPASAPATAPAAEPPH